MNHSLLQKIKKSNFTEADTLPSNLLVENSFDCNNIGSDKFIEPQELFSTKRQCYDTKNGNLMNPLKQHIGLTLDSDDTNHSCHKLSSNSNSTPAYNFIPNFSQENITSQLFEKNLRPASLSNIFDFDSTKMFAVATSPHDFHQQTDIAVLNDNKDKDIPLLDHRSLSSSSLISDKLDTRWIVVISSQPSNSVFSQISV